jgi:hypothetical protein
MKDNLDKDLKHRTLQISRVIFLLKIFDTFVITWHLHELRRKNKLTCRRNHGLSGLEGLNTVKSELESGQSVQWGIWSSQGLLHQIHQGSFIPQLNIGSIMKQPDDRGLENCRLDQLRRRRQGLNCLWS